MIVNLKWIWLIIINTEGTASLGSCGVYSMVADIGHLALSLSRPRQCDSATVRQNASHDSATVR